MSLMLNYERIVKNLTKAILNGTITSYNSARLGLLNKEELFREFQEVFDLKIVRKKQNIIYNEDDQILGLVFESKPIYIISINVRGIGDLILSDLLHQNISSQNILYFDIQSNDNKSGTNAPDGWINKNTIATIEYVSYNIEYSDDSDIGL